MNILAGPLERHILAAIEYVQAADRRVAVFAPGQERDGRLETGGCRNNFGLVPTGTNERVINVFRVADYSDIQRIAVVRVLLVADTAGRRLEPCNQPVAVQVLDLIRCVHAGEVDIVMINLQSGNLDEEGERPGAVAAHKVDVERLGALVQMREYKSASALRLAKFGN